MVLRCRFICSTLPLVQGFDEVDGDGDGESFCRGLVLNAGKCEHCEHFSSHVVSTHFLFI